MTSIKSVDDSLRKRIETILQDAYIEKCMGRVEFPETIIHMLEILFSHSSFDPTTKERLGIASVLLQMGLEMHTRVSTEDPPQQKDMRDRQQFVLAGDYYSSLFYHYLVQNHDYSLIEYFCQQVLSINEAKLSLHVEQLKRRKYNADMLANHKKVTSGLLLAVADYFPHQDDFIFLWKKTVTISRLLNDLQKSGKWMDFPPFLRNQVYQEWNELLLELDRLKEGPKQQLLSLLTHFEEFIQQFTVKES